MQRIRAYKGRTAGVAGDAWVRAEYATNMRVKRGELVWDPDAYPDGYPLSRFVQRWTPVYPLHLRGAFVEAVTETALAA